MSRTKTKNFIYFAERNIRGAWVVYGTNGIRQYYGYSKQEAMRMYNQEACGKIIVCKKGGK